MKTRTQELINMINAANVKSGKHKLVKELFAELIAQGQLDHNTLHAFYAKNYPGKPSTFFYAMQLANNFLNPRRVKPEPNEPTITVEEIKLNGNKGDQFILSLDGQFVFGIKNKKASTYQMLMPPLEFNVGNRIFTEV